MKKFILNEILLLSNKERRAKRVKFDENRTVVFGPNGVGKSCLLRSIYKTFGATPQKDHPTWVALDPKSLVHFSIDGIEYSIFREGKFYAIFDGEGEVLKTFESVTNELAPYLSDLFDFKIKLPDKNSKLISPPPAFLFLPYYVDQDASWQNNWNSFDRLQQIKGYREPIIQYHAGLRPNEYYEMRGELGQLRATIEELEREKVLLTKMLRKISTKSYNVDFNIDLDTFKEEVKQLLVECDYLKKNQESLKRDLVDLYNTKIDLESQVTIVKHALKEATKDYEYALKVLVDDHVDCPTCGARYENSFSDRFEIAKDEDRCNELLDELAYEIQSVNDHIVQKNSSLNSNMQEVVKIESILEIKKGEIKLKDVIENEGRNELNRVFESNQSQIQDQIYKIQIQVGKLDTKLKALSSKSRKDEILKLYHSCMREYLHKLDVTGLPFDQYKKIDTKIIETGSALPRALTAYYFSFFEVMRSYTSSTFCPIVIDSPKQNAQDLPHILQILEFINHNQPEGSQMILGLEELHGVDFDCNIIELSDKGSLLQSSEYTAVSSHIKDYQNAIWSYKRDGRLL